MKVLDFIVFGDVHLEAHNRYGLITDYIDPVRKVMTQIQNYAEINGIHHLIQLGDVFDSPNPLKTTQVEWLKILNQNPNLKYYIISGNHDYLYNKDGLDTSLLGDSNAYEILQYFESINALPNIKYYTQQKIEEIEGIPFDFMPFPITKPLDYKKPSIKIGHFEADGYKLDNGMEIKSDTKVDKYTILGHMHTPQYPVYPGSILQANFGEKPSKEFWHCRAILKRVKDDESELGYKYKLKLERHPVPIALPFKLINIKLMEDEDIKQLTPYKNNKEVLLKLIVKNDVVLPADLSMYNIETIVGCKNKQQALALENNILLDSKCESSLLDEKELLKTNLINQGLLEEQINRAIDIIDKIKPFSKSA